MKRLQQGSVVLGVIIGVVLGLAVALAVAVYVTKAPVPFANRGGTPRTAEQDAAEQRKNKDWDPNAPLYGKNPVRVGSAAASGASGAVGAGSGALIAQPPAQASSSLARSTGKPASSDPIADFAAKATPGPSQSGAPAAAAAPAPANMTAPAAVPTPNEPFVYFVQAGAYRTAEDAEAQRARVSLLGLEAKVSEREQSGRPVFRVRVGPLDRKDEAERMRDRLLEAKFDAAVVRVQR